MSVNMDHTTEIERVLVVVNPSTFGTDDDTDSPLLARVMALVSGRECDFEFLLVREEPSVFERLLPEEDNAGADEEGLAGQAGVALAKLCASLLNRGVRSAYTVRMDEPAQAAILDHIAKLQPDLVLKQSQGRHYFVGLFTNTDWELVRQSPAHLWFVNADSHRPISRVVTAIEASPDPGEAVSALDCLAFRLANAVAGRFGAVNIPVHAYRAPRPVPNIALAPPVSPVAPGAYPASAHAPDEALERKIAQSHRELVRPFEEYFQLRPEAVRLVEGEPGEVLPSVADEVGADVIVMSARNLHRIERLLDSVHAEPVLARATCDVVFAKEHLSDSQHEALDVLP